MTGSSLLCFVLGAYLGLSALCGDKNLNGSKNLPNSFTPLASRMV